MIVEVKFNCRDLVGDLREGAYTLPEGATPTELLAAAYAEAGRELTESVKKSLIFLFNNRHADWNTVLTDGGKLRVLYKILGG